MDYKEKYEESLKIDRLRINLKKLVNDLDECGLDYAIVKLKEAINEVQKVQH
jgi:hypothetical protein